MKDLTKYLVVRELINSFKLLKPNSLYFIIAAFLDAAFFFFWGFFTTPIRDSIVAHAVLISNKISEILAGRQPQGLLFQLFSPDVKPLTYKMIMLILLLFVIIYITYTIFHGTNWWLSRKIAGQKETYRQYLLGFAKINLLWISLYALYKIIDAIIGIRHVIVQKFVPGATNTLGTFVNIIFALVVLAAIFSYPTLKAKTIFKTPLKITIPLVILSASIYLAIGFVTNLIASVSVDAAIIAGITLVFPALVLIRIYITRVLTND